MTSQATRFTPQPTLSNPARAPEVLNLLLRLVNLSLSLGLDQTALFIAERYACLCPSSEEAIYLHALSLHRCGEHRQALELLKSTIVEPPPLPHASTSSYAAHSSQGLLARRPACEASIRCAYVYADACIALERPNEGSECLKRAFMVFGSEGGSTQGKALYGSYGSYGSSNNAFASNTSVSVNICLAKLAVQANKPDVAAQRYMEALREAWWCWEAYEGLCSIGKAPDAEATFAPIPVPVVQDTLDPHEDPPPANFLAAPPMDRPGSARTNGTSKPPSACSQKTTFQLAPEHRSQSATSHTSFFKSSTPSFQLDRGSSLFGLRGYANPAASTSTPVESQGAEFRFGEAEEIEEEARRARAASREPSLGPGVSASLDELALGDESSFFGPGAAKKTQNGQGVAGGLFGLTSKPAGESRKSPLFGQGLFFGQAGAQKHDAGAANGTVASSSTASFFTPVNAHAGTSFNANGEINRQPNGRAPPAVKRNIHQIDETLPEDSLHMQKGQQIETHRHLHITSANGTNNMETPVEGNVQVQQHESQTTPSDNMLTGQGLPNPVAGRHKPNLGQRQGQRLAPGNGGPIEGAANQSFASKVNRIVSNPRDRKRSKAGPSSLDDASVGTTASSSHSYDTNSAFYPASSSSPPATAVEVNHRVNLENGVQQTGSSYPSRTPTASGFAKLSQATQAVGPASQPLTAPVSSVDRRLSYRKQIEAAQNALAENWLRALFRQFAQAYSCLSKYDCPGAQSEILRLVPEQRNSARALLLLGKAHFNGLEYAKAEKAFAALRQLAPYQTKGLEYYSTLLWHLHRPTNLSYLAQELLAINPLLPQAWIATGNVFSHLEDHPNALKCFKRAIQSDPALAYSYTLAGHEAVTVEEWETAIGFFRESIRRDVLHYNAWFGLGNVYMKTGKNRLAEYHFRRAVEINPSNAMLVCCVGTVLERLDRKKEALELYERACMLAPTSPAVRFKRVRMLMDLKHYDAALRDLMLVRDMAPDEFNVHYLLGKLYGAMGDRINMTRNLTIAQDLEPRAAGRIREIIESAGQPMDETTVEEDQEDGGEGGASGGDAAEDEGDEDGIDEDLDAAKEEEEGTVEGGSRSDRTGQGDTSMRTMNSSDQQQQNEQYHHQDSGQLEDDHENENDEDAVDEGREDEDDEDLETENADSEMR